MAKHFENNHGSEKVSPGFLMMFCRVVFGPVVSVIGLPRPPIHVKLLLALSIVEPMKTHVHGFSSFRLNFTIDDGIGHGVVGLEWCGRLSVT